MLKRLLLTALAVTFSAVVGYAADQSVVRITIPVEKTSPASGKQMYASYCAPCHGVDGKGHGPIATALRAVPTNLTGLSRGNHGSFPDTHIAAVLEFGAAVPGHESPEMPLWGPILSKMNLSNPSDKQLRIRNLSNYIQSMQER
jgi:mono/diheme cytochrome c family protein